MSFHEIKREGLEEIARLEHIQWMNWANSIIETNGLTEERKERWKKLMVSYWDLSERYKEEDRIYARKVFEIIKEERRSRAKWARQLANYLMMNDSHNIGKMKGECWVCTVRRELLSQAEKDEAVNHE